jgi:hypothetical protein
LLDAAPADVENPPVIAATEAAGFDPTIFEGGAAMRAVGFHESDSATFVAEQDEILAQPADKLRRV